MENWILFLHLTPFRVGLKIAQAALNFRAFERSGMILQQGAQLRRFVRREQAL
jgi:hypothetical protein